jgi:hypothetical protein
VILRLFQGKADIQRQRLIMHQLLNNLFSLYTEGSITRADFEGEVYQYLAKNQDKTSFCHWKRYEYEDFLSWFYQRLHKAIDSYRDTGSSFEAFIGTVMRMAAKEYRLRVITKSVTEYSAWSVHVPELYVHEETQTYSYEKKDKPISQIIIEYNGRKNPKQLLALILKCYYHVSDDFIDRIADHIGIDKKSLKEMIEKLRSMRQKRDDEIYLMRERIYCQYYRCIVYEKRLSYIPENTNAYNKMKLRLEKARNRLENMRKRMAGTRTEATNKEVAEVIGVSKGSIDASLYNLKVKWEILSDKSLLN